MIFRVAALLGVLGALSLSAADWPAYRHDSRRSGISSERLKAPLGRVWEHSSSHAPSPAWPGPAKQDLWHRLSELSPTMTYDRAYQPVIAGGRLFYGSSSDDSLHCLDMKNGKELWSYPTGGPIRLAPAVYGDTVLVASDDGHLYCLTAADGRLRWRFFAGESEHYLPGNNRLICKWPVRGGIGIHGNTAYITAGIFPMQGVYMCAVNLDSGTQVWRRRINIAAQGHLVVSKEHIFVSTGRTAPAVFARDTGKQVFHTSGGGCFAVVYDDLHVQGSTEFGQLAINSSRKKETVVTVSGFRLIVHQDMVFIVDKRSLTAWPREKYLNLSHKIGKIERTRKPTRDQKAQLAAWKKELTSSRKWSVECQTPYELVVAGDLLIAGGADRVVGISTQSGKIVWDARVDGRAYGLAVSDGKVVVSTDQGYLYAFESGRQSSTDVSSSRKQNGSTQSTAQSSETTTRRASLPVPSRVESREYVQAAAFIADKYRNPKGYLVISNPGKGELAFELAKASRFNLVLLAPSFKAAVSLRKQFLKWRLLGSRVTVVPFTPSETSFQPYFANGIVDAGSITGGQLKLDKAFASALLSPERGALFCGAPKAKFRKSALPNLDPKLFYPAKYSSDAGCSWSVQRRRPLAATGEWSHIYGDTGNTACSQETLDGEKFELQWFGRPGPRKMADRHHRPMPPLYKNGLLFALGYDYLYALDSYNGTVLWEKPVPQSTRLGIMHDAGLMATDGRLLYIASGKTCKVFDGFTGNETLSMSVPLKDRNWGYVAIAGSSLLGSTQMPAARRRLQSRNELCKIERDFSPKATSTSLFAVNRKTGRKLWLYERGTIINATLTVGDGALFFIENRSPELLKKNQLLSAERLVSKGAYMVAIDINTGKKKWETQLKLEHAFQNSVYLQYSNKRLIMTGSYNHEKRCHYALYGLDVRNGKQKWHTSYVGHGTGGTHGEHWQHPAIVGDKIVQMQGIFDIETGKAVKTATKNWRQGGRGCGTVSASMKNIYYRGGNLYRLNFESRKGAPLTRITRPGCWINILPVGGLILVPEASSGCTCGFSLQTSLALRPIK